MTIQCEELEKSFGSHQVLKRVSFYAAFEHTIAFIGPSGGGKSTLLRITSRA